MGFEMDHTFRMLESAINGSIARQNIIAHNVSNINTPGFKHFVAEFNGQTEQKTLLIKTTSVKHISLNDNELSLTVTQDNSQGRADGNNVDLQKEMTLMVQNDIYFNAAVNQLNKKLAIQRYVLSGSE